jgi:hypothetical protein
VRRRGHAEALLHLPHQRRGPDVAGPAGPASDRDEARPRRHEQLEVAPEPASASGPFGGKISIDSSSGGMGAPSLAAARAARWSSVLMPHPSSTSRRVAVSAPGGPAAGAPDHDGELGPGQPYRPLLDQPLLGQPGRHLGLAEAEPAVRPLAPERLLPVAGEVGHDQPPARGQHPRRLRQHPRRVVGEVQHLGAGDGVEGRVRQRQPVHVAVPDLAVARLTLVEVGAGRGQHLVVGVDPEPEADLACQDLEDAAGAGADVEQARRRSRSKIRRSASSTRPPSVARSRSLSQPSARALK